MYIHSQADKIDEKEREIMTLKVKYARAKTLLKSQKVIVSVLSKDTSVTRVSGSNRWVRYRITDTKSSGGSAHP